MPNVLAPKKLITKGVTTYHHSITYIFSKVYEQKKKGIFTRNEYHLKYVDLFGQLKRIFNVSVTNLTVLKNNICIFFSNDSSFV